MFGDLADGFGFFNRLRTWLQGKKVYIGCAITALGAIGSMLPAVSAILAALVSWAGGSLDSAHVWAVIQASIAQMKAPGAVLMGAWVMAAKYAQSHRNAQALLQATAIVGQSVCGGCGSEMLPNKYVPGLATVSAPAAPPDPGVKP